MLRELGRRGLQDLAQHARLELHQRAVDLGPCPLPVIERCRIVAELDADLGEDAVGGRLDTEQIFLGKNVVGRDVADDIGPAEALRCHASAIRAAPSGRRRARGACAGSVNSISASASGIVLSLLSMKHSPPESAVTLENLDGLYKLGLCKVSAISCLPPAT